MIQLSNRNYLFSSTWILVPYFAIIGILIFMAIRMYGGYKRRFRLNKNLSKYISTVHDMRYKLAQLNQSLYDVSSNDKLDESVNDKIRLAIWRINAIQETLNNLAGMEKEDSWIDNQQSNVIKALATEQKEKQPEKEEKLPDAVNFPSANDQLFLEKVFIIIRENYIDPHFNVDTLSYKMGMSRSSFFNKIKAITGQAPADFIRQYRMERARELLRTKKYTISEIAFKSGFSDVKYFRDVFRKKYNQSPSQFSKNM